MLGALRYADAITTVSPTYANEIQTPEFGEGLDGVLRERSYALQGILNGIDVAGFDPATDKRIAANYTVEDRSGKAVCKAKLQEELGLEVRDDRPLMVMVTRLTRQKGMDLVMYALDRILAGGVQVAVLGTGDRDYEDGLRYFQDKYPGTMAARIEFDPALSQRMYAAADMFLMPSKFEPCGLSQIIAMRYGTLPIVRETGGLKDTVQPYNEFTGEGTGFSFTNFNGDEMGDAVFRAARLVWDNRNAWNQLVTQAMSQDFSWTRSADKYLDLYFFMHPEIERPVAVVDEPVVVAEKVEAEPEVVAEPEPKAEPVVEAPAAAEEPKAEEKRAAKPAAKKTATRKTTAKKATTTKAAASKNTTAKATTAKEATTRKRTTAAAKKAAEAEAAPEVKAETVTAEDKPAAKAPAKTAAKKTTASTKKATAAKKTTATKSTAAKATATKAAPKAAAKPAVKVEETPADSKAEATVETEPTAKTTTRKRSTTTAKKTTTKAATTKAEAKPAAAKEEPKAEVKAKPTPKAAEVKTAPKATAKAELAKEAPVSPAAPTEEKAPTKKTSVRKATAARKRR